MKQSIFIRTMAIFTLSSYPPIDKQLENLNQGLYRFKLSILSSINLASKAWVCIIRPLPPERYCYNIKEKMQEFRKSHRILKAKRLSKRRPFKVDNNSEKGSKFYKIRHPKPVYSPRFRSKFSKSREKLR